MGTVKTLLTFEEFEQLPDQPGKQELIRGELIEMPPADLKHNRISHRIYKRLDAAIEQAPTRGEARDLGEAFQLKAQVQSPIDSMQVCEYMHTALKSIVQALETAPATAVCTLEVLPEAERQGYAETTMER